MLCVGGKEKHCVLISKYRGNYRIPCPGLTCSVSIAENYFSGLRKNCIPFPLWCVCVCTCAHVRAHMHLIKGSPRTRDRQFSLNNTG